jgi:hypothetical protein
MKMYVEVDVRMHVFLTAAVVEGEWSASRSDRFIPEERASGTHRMGGLVDAKAGLDYIEE